MKTKKKKVKLHKSVRLFAEKIDAVLPDFNKGKGWEDADPEQLFSDCTNNYFRAFVLTADYCENSGNTTGEDVIKRCIRTAAYLMMIVDNIEGLENKLKGIE